VRDVMQAMEAWAPAGWAFDWDRIGLQLGRPDDRVHGVLCCLSVDRAAFDAAKRAKANMLVAHHPLIWNALKQLRSDDPHARLALDMAAAGMACFNAHTNLDVAPDGVNHVLAATLGLCETIPLFRDTPARQLKLVTFAPESHLDTLRDAMAHAGAGVIGAYTQCSFNAPGFGTFLPAASTNPFSGTRGRVNKEPEIRIEMLVDAVRLTEVLAAMRKAHPYEEPAYDVVTLENRNPTVGLGLRGRLDPPMTLGAFARQVCRRLKTNHVRVVGDSKMKVQRVAVMGGSGGSQIARIPAGVDVFVTGDVKYHEAQEAIEKGLAIIDAGHAATEKGIVPVMAARLRRDLPGIRVKAHLEPDLFGVVLGGRT
jgi:dinuclear metal center YbgI/SA1388 family protein